MSDAEQREEAIFEAALQLPANQRAAFLEKECAGDADLRRQVESLLGAFERAGRFMTQPASPEQARFSLPPTEKPGDRIGRYKLLEQIGEGGCGVVYVAEQRLPWVQAHREQQPPDYFRRKPDRHESFGRRHR